VASLGNFRCQRQKETSANGWVWASQPRRVSNSLQYLVDKHISIRAKFFRARARNTGSWEVWMRSVARRWQEHRLRRTPVWRLSRTPKRKERCTEPRPVCSGWHSCFCFPAGQRLPKAMVQATMVDAIWRSRSRESTGWPATTLELAALCWAMASPSKCPGSVEISGTPGNWRSRRVKS